MELEEAIAIVEAIDYENESAEEIQSKVQQVFGRNVIAPNTSLPNPCQQVIFRARSVKDFSEVESVEGLAYRKPEDCVEWGRAAMPRNSMFYGTTGIAGIPPNEFTSFKIGALFETMCCFRSTLPVDGEYKAIISTWRIIPRIPLKLFTVINPYAENNRVPIHIEFARKLDAELDKAERDGKMTKKDGYALQAFMYRQFGKKVNNEKEYIVPATIANIILNSSFTNGVFDEINGYDGIIYESVQCEDRGLWGVTCAAIMPGCADYKLELIRVEDVTIAIKNKVVTPTFRDHVGKIEGFY